MTGMQGKNLCEIIKPCCSPSLMSYKLTLCFRVSLTKNTETWNIFFLVNQQNERSFYCLCLRRSWIQHWWIFTLSINSFLCCKHIHNLNESERTLMQRKRSLCIITHFMMSHVLGSVESHVYCFSLNNTLSEQLPYWTIWPSHSL